MDNCLTLDHEGVMGILPHREPILLVDTVSECVPMDHIEAALYIDPEWDVFRGHFPGAPVLPGVYTVEAAAQAACLLLLTRPEYAGKTPLFLGIDRTSFRRKILPGDTLEIHIALAEDQAARAIAACRGEIYVRGQLAADLEVRLAFR